jgi:hypothetical protein
VVIGGVQITRGIDRCGGGVIAMAVLIASGFGTAAWFTLIVLPKRGQAIQLQHGFDPIGVSGRDTMMPPPKRLHPCFGIDPRSLRSAPRLSLVSSKHRELM